VAPPTQSILDLSWTTPSWIFGKISFAFRQGETEHFHLQSLALHARHFLHLLVAGNSSR
jgi:hypothetical protein